MLIGAGAYYASRNINQPSQETPAITVQEKIALVNSISNLSDDPALTDEVAQQRAAENIAVLKTKQNKLGPYMGILSKCYLPEHDVHWVNENGAIHDHVGLKTSLSGNASVARKLIYEMGGGMVVVIYENGYEAYGMDGKQIR